jgi:hypothetical protein
MTLAPEPTATAPVTSLSVGRRDRRGSWIPTGGMIATRFMELRKRRGLMITLVGVTIGIPTLFLVIRLLLHAFDPKSYGPAGGYDIFNHLVVVVLYVFGFIVAATLGCTAGSIDLTEGMFRHLVVTGRSRLALYLARIPAGLAIIGPLVAIGFAIVCTVCVLAAPTTLNYRGATVPASLSQPALENWAANHANEVVCAFPYDGPIPVAVPCGNGPVGGPGPGAKIINGSPGTIPAQPSSATLKAAAIAIAKQDYADYSKFFLSPSTSLMIKTGLWLELEALIGFIVGLGLGALIGQRTVAVIMMIVLEIILTPIFSRANIPHFINLQRAVVGLATAHLEPAGLSVRIFGGDGPPAANAASILVPETKLVAVCVILAWVIGWTILGAWRMSTRDA